MSFERLLRPRTIAVFGGAQAQEVIRQSDLMGYTGEIWPVHPKKDEILGRKVYRSVNDLPDSPDAAYVGVNRNLTIDIVRDLAQRDAGGAVCYATGFIEAGEEGTELQDRLLEVSGDMPLVGPNCASTLNPDASRSTTRSFNSTSSETHDGHQLAQSTISVGD